ncbi:MAG: hypothetical protein QXL14_03475 [Candidatus Aenigmatarchaeota archaeon]
MSCIARSYPRAEFEYDARHEYDFDKKSSRKAKELTIEEAFHKATKSYLYHISNFKDISFEDFAFIHSSIYRSTIANKEDKLPSGYERMYKFAEKLYNEYESKVSERARKFAKWLESEHGKYFLDAIKEEKNVKRRILLSNMLASYYIQTFYPYTINGAVEKYLDYEYKYVGRHVYKIWSNPLFWGAFGIGMTIYEEIERIKKVNDYLSFTVEDEYASEVFIKEIKTWLDATNNLTDFYRQLGRAINSIRDFFTSGQFISTIAGDVGSAVVADLIRRGVVIGLESLGFLLLNFTVAGRVARGVLGLAEFVKRSVLSFLGFQIFVEWPIDGVIQIWLNRYLEKIFDSNFNPNRLALTEQEIEELRKNKDIPDKWGGLTKYEWAELWKLLKALYFNKISLTEDNRRRLHELLDKADAKHVNAMILRLRKLAIEIKWKKDLIERFRATYRAVFEDLINCERIDYRMLSKIKDEVKKTIETINANTSYKRVFIPKDFDCHKSNYSYGHFDRLSGAIFFGQRYIKDGYENEDADELGYRKEKWKYCEYFFSTYIARWPEDEEIGMSYKVYIDSKQEEFTRLRMYASNYYLLDLLIKLYKDEVVKIKNAKLIKKNDMLYIMMLFEGEGEYELKNNKLKKKLKKERYLMPLSEAIGYGYLSFRDRKLEDKKNEFASSNGRRPKASRYKDEDLMSFSLVKPGTNEGLFIGTHAATGNSKGKFIWFYENNRKRIYISSEVVYNDKAEKDKEKVLLRIYYDYYASEYKVRIYQTKNVWWKEIGVDTDSGEIESVPPTMHGDFDYKVDEKVYTPKNKDKEFVKEFEIPLLVEGITIEKLSDYLDYPSLERDYYDERSEHNDEEFAIECFLSV